MFIYALGRVTGANPGQDDDVKRQTRQLFFEIIMAADRHLGTTLLS